MTNKDIMETAMQQSAADLGCKAEDFTKKENIVVVSKNSPRARKYLMLPFACNLVTYGSNIVASISEEYRAVVERYISSFAPEHCFETPSLNALSEALAPFGMKACFMAEYFLPDINLIGELPCEAELRLLGPGDFAGLYTGEWKNALCRERKELDVLGVGAYDCGKLVGLAGCSADCETMWQIGVDVNDDYRRRGIASAIVSRLAVEIIERGKVPFYCAAWSNIKSVRTAIKCGFRPAWAELTVKSAAFVDSILKK